MNRIYLVCQTQPAAGYMNTAIYAYTDEKEARRVAKVLNKEYSNCDGDIIYDDFECCDEDAHYYTVRCMSVNEKLATFFK